NAGGTGVAPVALLDADGAPLTTLEMRVELDPAQPLVIAPGVPSHLTLDFDLAAAHGVTWSDGAASVTVEPLLVADVGLEEPKPHRVRGPLVSVNQGEETFTLGIRPLRAAIHLGDRHLGRLHILTGAGTVYEVDGAAGTGSDGFALLAAKEPLTAVIAIGELIPGAPRQFRAVEVYAGSSIPGGELDGATGTVLARSGNQLTVKGAVLDRDGGVTLCATLTVAIADTTVFYKQGDSDAALDVGSVSVGQRIAALGLYDVHEGHLDAAGGTLRLLTTRLTGTINAAGESELELALQRIDGRRVDTAEFDFTGTATEAVDAADPAAYTLDTATLSLPDLAVDQPVRTFGFVAPFGAAPPDFHATTVVALANVRAHMQVRWRNGTGGLSVGPGGLALDLSGSGALHQVVRAGVATELVPNPSPTVEPCGIGGLYVLRHRDCTVYLAWDRFTAALQEALSAGAQVVHLGADGTYDDRTQKLSARSVRLSLR
ncbi:MAG TPA: hypothetical protein VK997_10260, partial [Deferrisomatales bacterium]|nr:hypothetical protein [Deferrisomatales bacterium]